MGMYLRRIILDVFTKQATTDILRQPSSTGRRLWAGTLCGAGTGRGGGGVVGRTPAGFVVVQPGLSQATSTHCASTMLIGG